MLSKITFLGLLISVSAVIAAPFFKVPADYGRGYERDGSTKHDEYSGPHGIQDYDSSYEDDYAENDYFRFPLREDDLAVKLIGDEDEHKNGADYGHNHGHPLPMHFGRDYGFDKSKNLRKDEKQQYGDRYQRRIRLRQPKRYHDDEYKDGFHEDFGHDGYYYYPKNYGNRDDYREEGKENFYDLGYGREDKFHGPKHFIRRGRQYKIEPHGHGRHGFDHRDYDFGYHRGYRSDEVDYDFDDFKNGGSEFDEYTKDYSDDYYNTKSHGHGGRKFRGRHYEKNGSKFYGQNYDKKNRYHGRNNKSFEYRNEPFDTDSDYVEVDFRYDPDRFEEARYYDRDEGEKYIQEMVEAHERLEKSGHQTEEVYEKPCSPPRVYEEGRKEVYEDVHEYASKKKTHPEEYRGRKDSGGHGKPPPHWF